MACTSCVQLRVALEKAGPVRFDGYLNVDADRISFTEVSAFAFPP